MLQDHAGIDVSKAFKRYIILNSSCPVDWWNQPTLSLQVCKVNLEIVITTQTMLSWQNAIKLVNGFLGHWESTLPSTKPKAGQK